MSVLSQFMGGGGTLVGQSIPMQGALANFTDGSQEYLRSGYMKTYSATYSGYKNRVPAGCVVRQSPVESATTQFSVGQTGSNGVVAYNGTTYTLYLSITSGGSINSYRSTDLVNWSTCGNFQAWVGVNTCYDYCVTNAGVIIVCTNDGATESQSVKRCVNGNWTNLSAAVFSNTMGGVAASPTTVVITQRTSQNTSTNAIFTSSDGGDVFTPRTGSGGTSITMETVFYSPCSGAFFIVGVDQSAGNQGNLILNKTTNGWTQTVGLASDSTFKVNSSNFQMGSKNHCVASSPTVTLISNGAGLLKRTTDGNTWTNVDLTTVAGTDVVYDPNYSSYRIYYSSVTAKFYVVTANSLNNGVRYLVSSDGLTWTPSFTFLPGYLPSNSSVHNYAFNLSTANSKILMPWVDTNASRARLLDMTSKMGQTDPDFVGIPATTIGNVPAYVRIL